MIIGIILILKWEEPISGIVVKIREKPIYKHFGLLFSIEWCRNCLYSYNLSIFLVANNICVGGSLEVSRRIEEVGA